MKTLDLKLKGRQKIEKSHSVAECLRTFISDS